MTARTWLITGVSSGFGRELTSQLLNRGEGFGFGGDYPRPAIRTT